MADKTKYNERIEKLKSQLIVPIEVIMASSALDLNIDEVKLIFGVINAQKLFLEPTIGSALTRKLQGNDLTFEYELLIERFLEDALINYGVGEVLQSISLQVANGGVFRHSSTDSEVASAKDVATLRQNYLSKGDTFMRRLIEFLNKNTSYYPEYTENTADGVNASKYAAFTGGLMIECSGSVEPTDCGISNPSSFSSCGGGVGNSDSEIFIAETSWGNNDLTDMGFDPVTLSGQDNVVPPVVVAQPINNYWWIVSTVKVYLAQVGTRIPMGSFTDTDADSQIFVAGEQDDKFWIRVKIVDTYENAVQFETQL